MRTNITINIGLETKDGNPVELHRAIHEIERAGIAILASGVVAGEWEGKQEQTLVVSGLAYDSYELKPRLYVASRLLSQHCIAVWFNGKGELIGDNPQGFAFDPELFHFHPRETKTPLDVACDDAWDKRHVPELSPCQAIQKAAFEKFNR
jgi:hypothetical protein